MFATRRGIDDARLSVPIRYPGANCGLRGTLLLFDPRRQQTSSTTYSGGYAMRPRDWRRRVRSLPIIFALAALLGTTASIVSVGASPATAVFAGAAEVTLPANSGTNQNATLDGISCWSAGNCTAVGGYADSSGYGQAMAATETGGSFGTATEVTPPANADTNPGFVLDGVSCSSAGNCTAVGQYENNSNQNQALAATETGGSFGTATEVTPPANADTSPTALLAGISCSSAGNCTAVGEYFDTSIHRQAMVATETGGIFAAATEVTLPANAGTSPNAYLDGISCSSAGNCTAVGDYEDSSNNYQAMVATETGGSFGTATEVTPPANAGSDPEAMLYGVSCTSVGNCTADGQYYDTSNHYQAMVVTETGGSFAAATEVTPPANAGTNPFASLWGISCSSAGSCTAAGRYDDSSNHAQAMVTTEAGGSFGTATEVTLPANAGTNPGAFLFGIGCSSAGICTAVGRYEDASSHSQAMVVSSVPSLALTSASLPSGIVDRKYSASLSASGGVESYTYSISSGKLPRGLSLDSSTGVISGTPKSAGTTSITFEVADPGPPAQQAGAVLSLTIVGPKIVIASKRVVLAGKTLVAPVKLTCKTETCSGSVELQGKSTKAHRVVVASARYRLAKGKNKTFDLDLTPTGQSVLATVAEKPLHETIVATVMGGRTVKRNVLVS
jgi:hypothetical protein